MSDFDTRATVLAIQIKPEWADEVRSLWTNTHAKIERELKVEFGEYNFEGKLRNFMELGAAPISIVSHHNKLYHEARSAFVHGFYYPALVAACALGERMLNHMILDLREEYSSTAEYRKVKNKSAIHKWQIAMECLEAWGIIEPIVRQEFEALRKRRQRSLHFDDKLYSSLRDEALGAIKNLQSIISSQFDAHGPNRWFIPNSKGGHTFLRKSAEDHPFVRQYYLGQCPKVGYLFAMNHNEAAGGDRWLYFDYETYPHGPLTDEEFIERYVSRKPEDCAPIDLPCPPNVSAQYLDYAINLRPRP